MSSSIPRAYLRQRTIPLVPRRRPPNGSDTTAAHRFFTSRSRLCIHTRTSQRPQLPFLWSPHGKHRFPMAAYLSTRTKENLKQQVKLGLAITAIISALLAAFGVEFYFLRQQWLELQYPTPEDWDMMIRWVLHGALHEEATHGFGSGMVNWGRVGSAYRRTLRMVEESKYASKDVQRRDGPLGDFPGSVGPELDITAKSEPWRRSYFQTLMGCARAAEHLEGWVVDQTRSVAFRADQMIGPSNPYPAPVLPGGYTAPLEENCVTAFESPEEYYHKALATKGFTNDQQIEAGLAYASWLDYHGRSEAAERNYDRCLDLACSALGDAKNVVDRRTGIIQPNSKQLTENILTTCTARAGHLARTGNTGAALNIYLSVLRARREAELIPDHEDWPKKETDWSLNSIDSIVKFAKVAFKNVAYPALPPSGDESFRRSRSQKCDEAALMNYIGEILFASHAPKQGLAWTREAVDMAESGRQDLRVNKNAKETCTQCLEVGLQNWQKMLHQLATSESHSAGIFSRTMGFFGIGSRSDGEQDIWEAEETVVQQRIEEFYEQQLDERLKQNVADAGRLVLS